MPAVRTLSNIKTLQHIAGATFETNLRGSKWPEFFYQDILAKVRNHAVHAAYLQCSSCLLLYGRYASLLVPSTGMSCEQYVLCEKALLDLVLTYERRRGAQEDVKNYFKWIAAPSQK